MSLRVIWYLISVLLWTAYVTAQDSASFESIRQKLRELRLSASDSVDNSSDPESNWDLNHRECKTSADCPANKICQKICFWLHPEDLWIGCKVGCVETTEAVLSEIVQRKESGILVDPKDGVSTPRSRSEWSMVKTGEAKETALTRFSEQLSSLAREETKPDGVIDAAASHRPVDICIPAPVCPLLCGITIDDNGCQQCACPHRSTNQTGCSLNRDCADLTQFCSRSEKQCKCRPEYVMVQESPLTCSPRPPEAPYDPAVSHGTTATSTAITPTALGQSPFDPTMALPLPKKFLEEGSTTATDDTISHMFGQDKTRTENVLALENSEVFPPVSSSATSQKPFDPAALWRALMLVSGSTSAPVAEDQAGDGQLASRCINTADCQPGLACCLKTYCDAKNSCGTAKFCLTKCFLE